MKVNVCILLLRKLEKKPEMKETILKQWGVDVKKTILVLILILTALAVVVSGCSSKGETDQNAATHDGSKVMMSRDVPGYVNYELGNDEEFVSYHKDGDVYVKGRVKIDSLPVKIVDDGGNLTVTLDSIEPNREDGEFVEDKEIYNNILKGSISSVRRGEIEVNAVDENGKVTGNSGTQYFSEGNNQQFKTAFGSGKEAKMEMIELRIAS